MFSAYENKICKHCDYVQSQGEDKDALEAARFLVDDTCNLVARQTCESPSGQCNAVQGRNFTHAVHVGKQSGQVNSS